MNSLEIEYILKNAVSVFEGVFPADKVPKTVNLHSAIVANTDPASKPGEHWVAFYFKDGRGIYFDSYGRPPLTKTVLDFLNANSKSWTWNKQQIQGYDTDVCGQYCIYFVQECVKGKTLHEICSKFTDDTFTNDKWISSIFQKIKHMPHVKSDFICQCCVARQSVFCFR